MIYVSCPCNQYTGGPTLAHQLCFILNQEGIPASMLYYGKTSEDVSPIHKNYEDFHNPYVTKLDKNTRDVIIVTETKTKLLFDYPNAKKYIWWMSVDNFFLSKISYFKRFARKLGMYTFSIENEERRYRQQTQKILSDNNILHLVQSEYAKIFLRNNGVQESNIFYLTDYIEEEVVELANKMLNKERNNIVLYNPKKGFEFTKKIINAMNGNTIQFIPLVNMSKPEVVEKLCTSKLYIDFGNHPGKDRFPREAVVCGCCIITGKRGSANNDVDIPIPDCYKFEDDDNNIPEIINTIQTIMEHYEEVLVDFQAYKMKTMREKDVFIKETVNLFSEVNTKPSKKYR